MASYLATPFIAAAGAAIAWQQYQINRHKLRMDQYERRLKIYEEVKKLLAIVTREGSIEVGPLVQFKGAVAEADFLFPPEVKSYLDELYKHAVDLGMWASQYRDYTQPTLEGYDHQKVVANKHAELRWITGQYEPALNLFRKYLTISAP
jgi:phosphoglycolate phosphatase-like HAD superfamily hydrolase